VDNPGNTPGLNNKRIRSEQKKNEREYTKAKLKYWKDKEDAEKIATRLSVINGEVVKPRQIIPPKEEDFVFKDQPQHKINKVGMRPWSATIRADEMSWRVSSLGNRRVQIYLNPNFTGDAIKEATLLITRLNAYVIARRNNSNTERDIIFDRYIHSPKVRHPKYDRLESLDWPPVVWARDLHTPTAEYYGYTLHRNPARKDGKFLTSKFEMSFSKDSLECGTEFKTVEVGRYACVWIMKDKLTATSVSDFLKGKL
jgi:hypothetical protein